MQTTSIPMPRVRSLTACILALCCGGCISVHQTNLRSPVPHPPVHIVEKSDELVLELKPRLDINFDHALETAIDDSEVNNTAWQLPKAQIGLDGTLSLSALQLSAGLGYSRVEQEGYPSGIIELGVRPVSLASYLGLGFRWRKSWSETDYTYSSSGAFGAEQGDRERVLRQANDYLKDLFLHFSHNAPAWSDGGGYFLSVEVGFIELLRIQDRRENTGYAKKMGSLAVGTYRKIDPSRRVVAGLRVTRLVDRHLPEIVAQIDWKVGRLAVKEKR